MSIEDTIDPLKIVFGLSRKDDERSLADFFQLFSQNRLTSVVIPRMTDEEIHRTVDMLSSIMRSHLSEKEYHSLFLGKPR